jgi:hypothetical protein
MNEKAAIELGKALYILFYKIFSNDSLFWV